MKFLVSNKGGLVSYFFLLLCVFSLFMVWFFLDKKEKRIQNAQNVSRFEAHNFTYSKIENNIFVVEALGSYAKENLQDEYQLENLIIHKFSLENKKKETLKAKFANYNNNAINFTDGVNYIKDSMNFYSQKALYDLDTKSLEGKGDFKITSEKYNVIGKNIIYKDNKVIAKNIFGKIKMDEK